MQPATVCQIWFLFPKVHNHCAKPLDYNSCSNHVANTLWYQTVVTVIQLFFISDCNPDNKNDPSPSQRNPALFSSISNRANKLAHASCE